MPTPATSPGTPAQPRVARARRRPRLVPDDTGVRLREHAAQDRYLLDIVERLLAA